MHMVAIGGSDAGDRDEVGERPGAGGGRGVSDGLVA